MLRAIEDTKKPELKKLEEAIHADVAVLFSDLDSFELAGDLLNNKTPAKAKPGQEAPEDIEIKAGMTELPPGPAISELGAVGLKTKVTDGKLEIMENRVIVKKGEAISQKAADIMSKLDIKPFSIGFIPLSSYDVKENKFYAEFSIDREGTLESLKDAYGRALPFAVEIGYATSETIGFLLGKAQRSAMALEKFETVEAPVEEKKEEEAPKEEVKEESSEEKKEDATAEESKEEKAAESEEAPKGVPPKSDEGGKVKEDQTPDEETKSEGEEK